MIRLGIEEIERKYVAPLVPSWNPQQTLVLIVDLFDLFFIFLGEDSNS